MISSFVDQELEGINDTHRIPIKLRHPALVRFMIFLTLSKILNFNVYSTHITICDIISVRLNDKSHGQTDWSLGARVQLIRMAGLAI